MEKSLEQLDELARENSFGGAHNAITCAITYRNAYSEYYNKYNSVKGVLIAIRGLLSTDLNELIDAKLKENGIENINQEQ